MDAADTSDTPTTWTDDEVWEQYQRVARARREVTRVATLLTSVAMNHDEQESTIRELGVACAYEQSAYATFEHMLARSPRGDGGI